MRKILLLAGIFFCSFISVFSQSPPTCPSLSPGIGSTSTTQTIVCAGACVPLTATVVTTNQTTSYSVSSIPYAPFPYSGGTGVSVGTDDIWSPIVNLPFSFCFNDSLRTQCVIGSNGEITFDLANANGYDPWSIGAALPSSLNVPGNTICGVYRDIDPAIGGSVYYYITGAAPCRALVVCFDSVPLFYNTSATSTCGGTPYSKFQMVLYETTNYIDVIIDNSFSCSTWNGGYGIIGVQNAAATIATCAPGWNYPSTPTGNFVAFRFTPTGAPLYTVTWTGPGGFTANTLTTTVCPLTNSTYTVTMNITSCNGSNITLTDTVQVIVTPGATLAVNNATICSGNSATLTVSGGTTYSWTPSTGLSATTGSMVTASPSVTTVYTVYGTGGGPGCVPIATSTVTVVPALTVTVNVPPTICSGTSTPLTAAGAATYSWSPGTGLNNTNTANVIASPTTTTIYTVTGSSGGCPPGIATTTVSVTPSYTISANGATICPTSSAVLIATGNGAGVYNWTPGVGLSSTNSATVTANPPTTTTYTISGGICVTPTTCVVNVVPNCTIAVNSATVCLNNSATLTATGGALSYAWSPPTGLSATTGTTVIANPLVSTIYTVSGNFGAGQPSLATATVVVNPLPVVSVNNATICQGLSTHLLANGAANYSWAPPTGLSSLTGSNVIASPGSTTVYTITGTSTLGCSSTTVAVVGVNPSPTASITPFTASGCTPLCVTYSVATTSIVQNCAWDFGAAGTSSGNCNPNTCFKTPGIYTVKLTLTDLNGCIGKATATSTVYPMPQADFSASPQPTSILESTVHFYDLTTSAPDANWNWNFGDLASSADTSSVKSPVYFYKDTGSYLVHLHVSTAYGCVDSTVKWIRINDDYELFVPNAFSPNGDGINEVFLPQMTGVVNSGYKMYVYDRWGNLLFFTDSVNKGWDGTINGSGQIVQQDVYVWKINLRTTLGQNKQVSGHVSIVK